MKNAKMLGLLAGIAAALMVFAGSASATITSNGSAYTGTIHGSGSMTLHTGVTISCKQQTFEGSITNGSTEVPLTAFISTECGPDTITTLNEGRLFITGNGTVTSTGLEITKLSHRTIFGFPITQHCILKTNNTQLGTLTEGVSPAVIHVSSEPISHVETDGACGTSTIYTGKYTITNPGSALVVH